MQYVNNNFLTVLPQRVSILGAARSGLAAATYLLSRGVTVFISDTQDPELLGRTLAYHGLSGIAFEGGAHSDRVLDADMIVLSPGVPSDIPVLVTAQAQKIPVWSEIELAYRLCKAPVLAITGSSGKSTTTSLVGCAVEAAGIESVTAGNIGLPAIGALPQLSPQGMGILELSSFQLESIIGFKPAAAAVLNFMKNHLDRYADEESYYAAKKRIVLNCDDGTPLILNSHDERLISWASELGSRTRIIWFGAQEYGSESVWLDGPFIMSSVNGHRQKVLNVTDMHICGPHNHFNAAAATALCLSVGIPVSAISNGICSFTGLKHRLEFIAEAKSVRWYNDSKSTTAESVLCAITAFKNNVHLIAGGRDKGCDFTLCKEALHRHVKKVYLIGEAALRMQKEWNGLTKVEIYSTLDAAVYAANATAELDDAVVLSPGCSSFDMFTDYEHRGKVFKDLVHGLV